MCVSVLVKFVDEPPAILTPPSALMKMADGSTYSVDCAVFGAPRPVISWKKDGRDLTGGRFVVYDNGTLTILVSSIKPCAHCLLIFRLFALLNLIFY